MRLADKIELVGGGTTVSAQAVTKSAKTELGDGVMPYSAALPFSSAIGCTFSTELCEQVAYYRAAVARNNGEAFAGAVCCGIMRDPMSVGASEFFSEDPFLTAELLKSCRTDDGIGFVFTDSLGQGAYADRTIDDRALNELYLYPLKKAGRVAAALQFDEGYLNGERLCESRGAADRLIKYVRADAAVLTEYRRETKLQEFTGAAYILGADGAFKRELYRAVVDGKIIESKLDRGIERILATAVNTYERNKTEPSERLKSAVVPDLSRASSVLLKNDGALPTVTQKITLFGTAADFIDGDRYGVKPIARATDSRGEVNVFLITDYERDGISPETQNAIAETSAGAPTVVVICGGCACELGAAKNAHAILFCPACRDVAAIIDMLTGDAPQGRLPFTWCDKKTDYPANNIKYGKRGDFRYESLYNGYMLFGNFTSAVAYPFGHGLDYTEYEIGKVGLKADCSEITATFDVKNTGERAGSVVCQAYLTAVDAPVYGLKKRLVAFTRLRLEAGECKRVTLVMDASDIAVYDAGNARFVTLGGKYAVDIGLSSADIRASAEVKLTGDKFAVGADKKTAPAYYGYGGAFEPTAPEIEKLLKTPFIKKAEARADLAPPSAVTVKKAIKKARKTAQKQLLPLIEHKINSVPDKFCPSVRRR